MTNKEHYEIYLSASEGQMPPVLLLSLVDCFHERVAQMGGGAPAIYNVAEEIERPLEKKEVFPLIKASAKNRERLRLRITREGANLQDEEGDFLYLILDSRLPPGTLARPEISGVGKLSPLPKIAGIATLSGRTDLTEKRVITGPFNSLAPRLRIALGLPPEPKTEPISLSMPPWR